MSVLRHQHVGYMQRPFSSGLSGRASAQAVVDDEADPTAPVIMRIRFFGPRRTVGRGIEARELVKVCMYRKRSMMLHFAWIKLASQQLQSVSAVAKTDVSYMRVTRAGFMR